MIVGVGLRSQRGGFVAGSLREVAKDEYLRL